MLLGSICAFVVKWDEFFRFDSLRSFAEVFRDFYHEKPMTNAKKRRNVASVIKSPVIQSPGSLSRFGIMETDSMDQTGSLAGTRGENLWSDAGGLVVFSIQGCGDLTGLGRFAEGHR